MGALSQQNKSRDFNPDTFLATIGEGRKNLTFVKKQGIFAQGDAADAVFYIQKGKVKLTVVSKTGREATLGLLGMENFFGEGALAGQSLRMGSASAMTDCEIQRIDKKAMMAALHREPAFSELFVAYLLKRNVRYEEDLVDQLFNSSEKRLARVLLSAGSLWQGRRTGNRCPQNQPGESGGDGWHHSFPRKLFHEPIQETGVRRLLRRPGRWTASPQFAAQRCSA
jgi:CRP-like cAMP-binding protein